jgi:hypothetical protein
MVAYVWFLGMRVPALALSRFKETVNPFVVILPPKREKRESHNQPLQIF